LSFLRRLFGRKIEKQESKDYSAVLNPSMVANFDSDRPVGSQIPLMGYGTARLPVLPLPFKWAYNLAYSSDILRTVIRALVTETFRNGIAIKQRYVMKCKVCGAEFHHKVDRCPICGSTKFYVPNPQNKQYLEKVLRDANLNDEALVDVLMAIDWDLNVVDNAYLVVIKKYFFDDEGNIVGAEPVEVLRADPRYMQLVMSKDGRPGYTDDGKVVVFCPEHRDEFDTVDPDEVGKKKCPVCGKTMLPAYFRFYRKGNYVFYTGGEVLHIKKFTYGIGYGYPPIMSILFKVLILLRQDYFMLLAYTLQRSPRGILVIKTLNRESVERAWSYLEERARNNPWMIYPLIVEGDPKARNIIEWLDLSFRPQEFNLMEYRQELRRSISALYGVTPIWVGEPGGSGRDTMQVLVTNRAVEMEQRLFNEKVLPWLTKQLGVDDWTYQLIPNEMRDVEKKLKILEDKLRLAEKLKELGYVPKVISNELGEIDITWEPAKKQEENVVANVLSTDTDKNRRSAERYYERFETGGLEGENRDVNAKPRKYDQRFTGEPTAPQEELEGEDRP